MHLRWRGVPLHPALVHFPIVFWFAAPLCDALAWWSGEAQWAQYARHLAMAGIVTAVPAMLSGALDLLALPQGPKLDQALQHAGWMLACLCVFGFSLVLSALVPKGEAAQWLLSLNYWIGMSCLVAGAHRGGVLVYVHGLGNQAERDVT